MNTTAESERPPLTRPPVPELPPTPLRRLLAPKWLRRALWVALTVVLVEGALALLVPWAIKGPVLRAVSEQLGRTVSVAEVRFNPFKLLLTVDGLQIHDKQPFTEELFSVKHLSVDISSESIWVMAPVLDAVDVSGSSIHLVRTPTGALNISDLLEKLAAEPAQPQASPARFSMRDLHLHGGSIHFDDRAHSARHAIEQIEFSLPYVASFKDKQDTAITPLLSARVYGGEVRVGAESKPFKSSRDTTLHLSVKGLNLAQALSNLPALAPWKVDQGQLDSDWQVTLKASGEAAAAAPPSVAPAGLPNRPIPPAQGALSIVAKAKLEVQNVALSGPKGERLSWGSWVLGSDSIGLDLLPGAPRWHVKAGSLLLKDLQLRDKADAAPLVSMASLALGPIQLDGLQRVALIEQIEIAGAQFQAHRTADGKINLQTLIEQIPGYRTSPTPAAVAESAPAHAAAPWRLDVPRLTVARTGAQWSDDAAQPPVELAIKELQGHIDSFSTAPDNRVAYELETQLGSGGLISLKGHAQLGAGALNTQLNVSALNLTMLQPYLSELLNLRISKGHLDLDGQVGVDSARSPDLRVRFKGSSTLDELYTREPGTQEDLVRWKRLSASGLEVDLHPVTPSDKDHVRIGGLHFQDLFAKVVIDPRGRINLQDLVKKSDTAKAPEAAGGPSAPSPKIELGGVKISGGRVNFTDLYIKPNYTTTITDLSATVSALGPKSPPAQINLEGRVEGDAPLSVQGRINPLAPSLFLDIAAKARGIDLPTFSPYSTKYAGYPIVRGKLSVELSYKIDQGALEAQNTVFLDQLTFGERVDSPTATQLPVLFAVALLKNSRGEININLPIAGSLNDPQFSVGSIVVQVLVNLLKKAVTSPFTLLASVFGSGVGDLSTAEFAPGTAELLPDALPRLVKLSEALESRPELKLDLAVHVDTALELGDLRRARLMARLHAERRRRAPAAEAFDADPRRWDEKDYAQWVQRIYDDTSIAHKPRNVAGVATKIPIADMEALLLSAITVSDAEWLELAQGRAQSVRKVLADKIPTDRVFTLAPHITTSQAPTESPAPTAAGSCLAACVTFTLH